MILYLFFFNIEFEIVIYTHVNLYFNMSRRCQTKMSNPPTEDTEEISLKSFFSAFSNNM